MKTTDLTAQPIDVIIAGRLGLFYCEKYCCIPVRKEDDRIFVAMSDPNMNALRDISDLTGCFIEPLLCDGQQILFYINAIFRQQQMNDFAAEHAVNAGENSDAQPDDERLKSAPAVRFIDSVIETGVLNRATDIHIEPYGKKLRVRYRMDGMLTTLSQVDLSMLPNAVSRLKVMGGMDISEKRFPQDGHFTTEKYGEEIDFRISTLPTLYGEKAAVRLLYDGITHLKKDELGFFPEDLPALTRLFNQPYGAVFMTGPTGSGKSTTLNCFLEEINKEELNIVTVEDPVENPIIGVNHMSVEPNAGLTFVNALRHILRQDPDVIIIGEIRDGETARIAVQAAITGHLVLSTLHTNDAAGVVERLTDIGIEPYLAATALNGILSQRLVRRVCPHCKSKVEPTDYEANILRIKKDSVLFAGKGCGHCGFTGYKGRLAIYEYILMDENLRRMMSADPFGFAADMRKRGGGLRGNALRNMFLGNTDAKEVIRVLSRDIA